MINVTFNYSLDGGTTFQTAITCDALSVHAYLMPEGIKGTESMGSTQEARQKCTPRLWIDLVLSSNDFNPANNANGASNFTFIQKWCCAPIRRIYNADYATVPGFDGWTEWDSSSNTNYVNMRDYPQYDFHDFKTATRLIRQIVLHLEMYRATSL